MVILLVLLLVPIGINSRLQSDTGHDQEVLVEMYQFDFDFILENGSTYTNEITLYTGVAYLFNVTSVDVKHGMDLKGVQFRPEVGQYQTAVITFDTVETINMQCKVLCNTPGNTGHGGMAATLYVVQNPDSTLSSTSATTSDTLTSETSTNSNLTTITETVTQTVTSTTGSNVTVPETVTVPSNQTVTDTTEVTTTMIEQVSFSLFALVALVVTPLVLRRGSERR